MPRKPSPRWQAILKLVVLVALVVGANIFARSIADALNIQIRPHTEDMVHRLIMVSAVCYAILIAIPFVPGVEVGLAIIAVLGPKIVPLVYLGTLVGLSLSFAVGRLVSLQALADLCSAVKLTRTESLLRSVEPLGRDARVRFLLQQAPRRFVPLLLRHRYLALGLAINLPGNFLIGGGGGIGLVAGLSGLYSVAGYIATIAIAVSPVPLAIYFFGIEFLPA